MDFKLHPIRNLSIAPLSSRDAGLLVTYARTLRRLADAGQQRSLLRGKNIGLLCESGDCEEARRFRRAATDLGARVAHIRPHLSAASSSAEVVETGRMLGRLYDGIECLGLDASIVGRLGAAADVPVYDGISCRDHPAAKLAEQVSAGGDLDESHGFMVQAILLSTLS